ncbi:efflux RND transporter periplasmic adaptor subunit [Beggiatoa alba]|nr:efflux RND transporter periplasmic adaptor subunit [Beggiatoa alba]
MTGFFNNKTTRAILSTVLLPIFSISCSDPGTSAKKKQPRGHLVRVSTVINSAMHSQQILSGTLEAKRSVQIFNQEEGLILAITAYPGDVVDKDQVIIKLDAKLIRAERDKAEIAHRQAALDLKRLKQLRRKRLTTEEALTQAQTTLELARAEETLLKTRFQYTQIKAPFNGVISQRLKEPGDVVAKFSHILSLADTSKLKAKVPVSERLLPAIQAESQINIQIDALGSQTYPARISRIFPTIDNTTRQGTIEVLLDNPPAFAKPGQLCRITLKGQTTARLHIPLAALKYDFKGSYVFKIVKNKAVLTRITTGIQLANDIEVSQGLEENDQIVTHGFLGLSDNKTIKIVVDEN